MRAAARGAPRAAVREARERPEATLLHWGHRSAPSSQAPRVPAPTHLHVCFDVAGAEEARAVLDDVFQVAGTVLHHLATMEAEGGNVARTTLGRRRAEAQAGAAAGSACMYAPALHPSRPCCAMQCHAVRTAPPAPAANPPQPCPSLPLPNPRRRRTRLIPFFCGSTSSRRTR